MDKYKFVKLKEMPSIKDEAAEWFHSEVRFDEGIRKTIENVLAHPELQEDDPEFDAYCDRVIAALEKAKKEI